MWWPAVISSPLVWLTECDAFSSRILNISTSQSCGGVSASSVKYQISISSTTCLLHLYHLHHLCDIHVWQKHTERDLWMFQTLWRLFRSRKYEFTIPLTLACCSLALPPANMFRTLCPSAKYRFSMDNIEMCWTVAYFTGNERGSYQSTSLLTSKIDHLVPSVTASHDIYLRIPYNISLFNFSFIFTTGTSN